MNYLCDYIIDNFVAWNDWLDDITTLNLLGKLELWPTVYYYWHVVIPGWRDTLATLKHDLHKPALACWVTDCEDDRLLDDLALLTDSKDHITTFDRFNGLKRNGRTITANNLHIWSIFETVSWFFVKMVMVLFYINNFRVCLALRLLPLHVVIFDYLLINLALTLVVMWLLSHVACLPILLVILLFILWLPLHVVSFNHLLIHLVLLPDFLELFSLRSKFIFNELTNFCIIGGSHGSNKSFVVKILGNIDRLGREDAHDPALELLRGGLITTLTRFSAEVVDSISCGCAEVINIFKDYGKPIFG